MKCCLIPWLTLLLSDNWENTDQMYQNGKNHLQLEREYTVIEAHFKKVFKETDYFGFKNVFTSQAYAPESWHCVRQRETQAGAGPEGYRTEKKNSTQATGEVIEMVGCY